MLQMLLKALFFYLSRCNFIIFKFKTSTTLRQNYVPQHVASNKFPQGVVIKMGYSKYLQFIPNISYKIMVALNNN